MSDNKETTPAPAPAPTPTPDRLLIDRLMAANEAEAPSPDRLLIDRLIAETLVDAVDKRGEELLDLLEEAARRLATLTGEDFPETRW